jgi:hypothetical protein
MMSDTFTPVEKGAFLKLFNRSGCVLNFTTNDFDTFTMGSVGVALCQQYGTSKGKSLMIYVNDAQDDKIVKLFSELLAYYEFHYQSEIDEESEFSKLYKKCRIIMDRVVGNSVPLSQSAKELKQKFSSDYISAQIELMLKMAIENPTEAIGKAKEFVESCCKTILETNSMSVEKNWDMGKLVGETTVLLKLSPDNIPDTSLESKTIKSLLGNLRVIASNMATLRNAYGSGHGKSANYKGLEARHAKLSVGCAITLAQFLWDTHEYHSQKNKIPTISNFE